MRSLLLIASGLLAVLVVIEWRFAPGLPALTAPPVATLGGQAESEQATASEGFQLPPLADFDAVVERPLFVEGRRPPEPEADDGQAPGEQAANPNRPAINLKAILIIDGQRSALVQGAPDKGGVTRLRSGDSYQGWAIKEIRPDRLVLGQGEKSEEYLLRHYEKVPLPKAQPKRRRPRQPVKRTAAPEPAAAKKRTTSLPAPRKPDE